MIEGWKIKSMSEICKVRQGLQINISRRFKEEAINRYKYITIQYLNNPKNIEFIENPLIDLISTLEDILFVRTGNTGQIVTNIIGVYHNNFFKIDYDRKQIEKDYLVYVLKSEPIQNIIKDLAGSTTIPDLNHKDFYSIRALFPTEKKEQQKIADILSSVDNAIESTSKIISKQKRIKTALMQDLLTNGIDENGKIRSEQTHQYKKSPLGRIPVEWKTLYFEENILLLDGDRGSNYPSEKDLFKDGYCLFLSAKNVTKNGFKFDETVFISKEKDKQLRKGKLEKSDIILTTRGTVGNTALYDNQIPYEQVRINSGMLIIKLNINDITSEFLYLLFNSFIIQNQINSTVFGSAQPQLTVKEIKKFSFIFPKSETEQQKISKILSKQDEAIEQEEKKLAKLERVKTALMQDLLSGKVRVNYE